MANLPGYAIVISESCMTFCETERELHICFTWNIAEMWDERWESRAINKDHLATLLRLYRKEKNIAKRLRLRSFVSVCVSVSCFTATRNPNRFQHKISCFSIAKPQAPKRLDVRENIPHFHSVRRLKRSRKRAKSPSPAECIEIISFYL